MNINIILIIAIFVLIHYMYGQNGQHKQLEGFSNNSNNIPAQHPNPPSPLTGYEPTYEPKKWNDNPNIKRSHNCYSYMLNNQSRCLENLCKKGNCKYINPQPGHQSGMTLFVDTKNNEMDPSMPKIETIVNYTVRVVTLHFVYLISTEMFNIMIDFC